MDFVDILSGGASLAAVLSVVVEISPVKVKPWSYVARWIGGVVNQPVLQKIDTMGQRLTELETSVEHMRAEAAQQNAISARVRILRFGDEVRHGQKHTKDHFDQILMDIKKYDDYCRTHPEFPNNVTELTSKRIKEIYQELLETNGFL